ncbi:unnamed protein product [Alopecurus aequalis]
MEAPSRYYDDLARNLTSLYNGADNKKKYMLTAAPQCPFPDASLAVALGTGLFDHVWVQFYNNPPCQFPPPDASALRSAWLQWTAALPSATVYLGPPASLEAAGSGYVDADTVMSQPVADPERGERGPGPPMLQPPPRIRSRDYRLRNISVKIESIYRPKRYTYSEVERMTNTFAHKLGQGGHGDVYRGDRRDAHQITVKVLKNCKGSDKDFMNEVASIGEISHENVAPLLGFCLQGPTRALIYEYMQNGSLESYALNSDNSVEENYSLWLYWEKLFDIALGVARGLEYLHEEITPNSVHISIKPRNILLDQELCPRISDVGVANLCLAKESKTSTHVVRERDGYDAPEVVSRKFGPVTSKSDVYSYGMIVLEMVRAKRHVKVGADTTSKYFAQWLYEHLDQFCDSISDIDGDTIIVGLWCTQTVATNRPSMSRVVEMLESSNADLELPRRTSEA